MADSGVKANDPLSAIVVDRNSLDRASIAEVLRDRLALDQTTGGAVHLRGLEVLDPGQKILLFLLLRKAAVLLEISENDGATPSTVTNEVGIPGGTVRRRLPELLGSHHISQHSNGDYFLSNAQVSAAIKELAATPEGESSESRTVRRPKSGNVRKSRRSRTEKAATSLKSTENSKKPVARTGARSPTALVVELRDSGYFKQPRTLSEVQKRLKDKTGHQIPVTSLSPIFTRLLRSGELDRERDPKGIYAYSSKAV
jgi:hypothetical protein